MPPTHPSQADVAAAYRTLIAHETERKEQDFYRTRLQRLEQATEPAEVTGRDFLEALPTVRECFSDYVPPAAAEPAEKETKAHCLSEIEGWVCSLTTGHDGDHTAYDQDGPAYTWPAASPVVPARTETSEIRAAADALSSALVILDPLETGHWEHAWRTLNDLDDCAKREKASATAEAGGWDTWDTVPENVTVVSSFLDHRYRKVDGEVFRVLEDGKQHKAADFTPTDMRSFAPFVAAEEG
ncbi:hypothetical protein QM716_01275 [Rhodococcus sp. IEGM 1409]|uniref:hypothetical protein n=1 Tax=Rhodococcus sp. IEGM 1409 TaxID=3047082 RepID=UPI0024B7D5B1|nr:hypothetical protein [Rhodococcus sp. IEGM 1409]MDI9898479.1 hypothetical protein [Rhodococcus sp. IEGM 1409]